MESNEELYLEITDDLFCTEGFDPAIEYSTFHEGLTKNIRMHIKNNDETVGYLECTVFYPDRIEEMGMDIVAVGDELSQVIYETMRILQRKNLPHPYDSGLSDKYGFQTFVPVYLDHIAIREDYRGRGFAKWFLKNLFTILERNYNVFPYVIIVKLFPEKITWDQQTPVFRPLEEKTESKNMYAKMKNLFTAEGYVQHGKTQYFIKTHS